MQDITVYTFTAQKPWQVIPFSSDIWLMVLQGAVRTGKQKGEKGHTHIVAFLGML